MGRGSSKASGGGVRIGSAAAASIGKDALIDSLAKQYASGDLYGSEVNEQVQDWLKNNDGDIKEIMDDITGKAAVIRFGGSTKEGDSISDKPYDPNDFKTWKVGDEVEWTVNEGGKTTYPGKVAAVNKKDGSLMVVADGNGLLVNDRFGTGGVRAKKRKK